MRQIETEGSHRDISLGESGHVRIGMRVGTAEIGVRPEIDATARIDAAVVSFDVGGEVLRYGADAAERAALRTGDVDVEQATGLRFVRQDLLDDVASQVSAAGEVD